MSDEDVCSGGPDESSDSDERRSEAGESDSDEGQSEGKTDDQGKISSDGSEASEEEVRNRTAKAFQAARLMDEKAGEVLDEVAALSRPTAKEEIAASDLVVAVVDRSKKVLSLLESEKLRRVESDKQVEHFRSLNADVKAKAAAYKGKLEQARAEIKELKEEIGSLRSDNCAFLAAAYGNLHKATGEKEKSPATSREESSDSSSSSFSSKKGRRGQGKEAKKARRRRHQEDQAKINATPKA